MDDPRLTFLTEIGRADIDTYKQRLALTRIEIVAGPKTLSTHGGQVLIFQLTTLLARLFDWVIVVGDKSIAVVAPAPLPSTSFVESVTQAAQEVRNEHAKAHHVEALRSLRILVGGDEETGSEYDLYVGATDWDSRLSVIRPQAVEVARFPCGALAAGALAAAEVFKQVFADALTGANALSLSGTTESSLSLLTYSTESVLPSVGDQPIETDLTVVGCGSVGCGFLLGLIVTPGLAGRLIFVDNGTFDERNPFKYQLLDYASATQHPEKAIWARDKLQKCNGTDLIVDAFVGTAYDYIAQMPVMYLLPLLVSAVDTVDARFEIQDTLPKRIINAGVDGMSVEVSVHKFLTGACLGCIGMASVRESADVTLIVEKTGLDADRIRSLIQRNAGMSRDDIGGIRAAARVPSSLLQDLDGFVGQPLLSLYNRALYAETTLSTPTGKQIRITTAFVSAFAGVLILAEFIKESVSALHPYRARNAYRQELLGLPADGRYRYDRDESGGCTCASGARRVFYMEKYPSAA